MKVVAHQVGCQVHIVDPIFGLSSKQIDDPNHIVMIKEPEEFDFAVRSLRVVLPHLPSRQSTVEMGFEIAAFSPGTSSCGGGILANYCLFTLKP